MPSMRSTSASVPPHPGQLIKYAAIFNNPVAERNIELQDVTVVPQAAIAQKVPRIICGKKIFADCEWYASELGQSPMTSQSRVD